MGTIEIITALLAGSVGGLLSNWLLYKKRLKNEQNKLRSAFKAEIEEMGIQLKKWLQIMSNMDKIENAGKYAYIVPNPSAIQSVVYENNCSELGILSKEEVEELAKFYNRAIQTKDHIDIYINRKESLPGSLTEKRRNVLKRLSQIVQDHEEVIRLLNSKIN